MGHPVFLVRVLELKRCSINCTLSGKYHVGFLRVVEMTPEHTRESIVTLGAAVSHNHTDGIRDLSCAHRLGSLGGELSIALTSTAALYTTETCIKRIQGSHKTMPLADQQTHSADARSFRRSYIVARRSSINFADRQPRTGRPTDRYPLNKLITFLSIRYRPTPE
jgi:hypothetical protein